MTDDDDWRNGMPAIAKFETRRKLWRLVLAGLALTVVVVPSSARAACAPPTIQVAPSVVAPGNTVTVHGSGFAAGCNDVGTGCSGPSPSPPSQGIRVQLRDGERVMVEHRVDADGDYGFAVEILVPTSAQEGRYEIVAVSDQTGETQPADVKVESSPGDTPSHASTAPGDDDHEIGLYHCGVNPTDFDGQRWVADDGDQRHLDQTTAPEDWSGNGVMTRLSDNRAVYVDSGSGLKLEFRPLTGEWDPPPCR